MDNQRHKDIKNFPIVETSAILTLIFGSLWVWNDYLASLITVLVVTICIFILLLSYIVELIEKTKVPRWYFQLIWIMIILPILLFGIFGAIYGFSFEWMKK